MEAVTDSGGRVTRALRSKRLTSIDSESSSRPGTPVQSKVTTASTKMSTDSPLKPRMTRRNSTSGVATPVKTPGRRPGNIASIAENEGKAEPPARRTRRRSMSTSIEVDGPIQPLNVKAPDFDTLSEEKETSRTTRSKSKSPQQTKSGKTSESLSKPKRKSLRNVSLVKADKEDSEEVDEKNVTKDSPQKDTTLSDNAADNTKVSQNEKNEEAKDSEKPQNKLDDDSNSADITKESQKEKNEVIKDLETPQNELDDVPNDADKIVETPDNNKETIDSEKPQTKLDDAYNSADIAKESQKEKNEVIKDSETTQTKLNDVSNKAEKIVANPEKNKVLQQNEDTEPMINAESSEKDPDMVENTSKDENNQKKNEEPNPEDTVSMEKGKSSQKETTILTDRNIDETAEEETNDQQTTLEPTSQKSPTKIRTDAKDDNDKTSNDNMKLELVCDEEEETPACDIGISNEGNTPDIVIKSEIPEDATETNSNKTSPSHHSPSEESGRMDDETMDTSTTNSGSKEDEDICKTPSPIKRKASSFKVQIATPVQSTAKGKVVAFNSQTSDDECEKSIYPKTPGSAKSKSFIEMDNSFQGDGDNDDSVVSVDDASDMEIPETQQVEDVEDEMITEKSIATNENEDQDEEEHVASKGKERDEDNDKIEESTTEIIANDKPPANEKGNVATPSKKTPNKLATPSISKDQKDEENTTELPDKLEKHPQEEENKETVIAMSKSPCKDSSSGDCPEKPEKEFKWCNPSVKGNTTKLDTIVKEEISTETIAPKESNEKVKKKRQRFLKRTEWNSDEETLNDDEELDDENEVEEIASDEEGQEEKPYRRKHDFHDDEAMVVDDYESGDSMDSEERREIEENEIPVDGESIGSHTTDDEHGDEEESDDSFIVSDNDEDDGENHLLVESNTDSDDENEEDAEEVEDVESKKREKKKPYKRIQRLNESSSSDEQEDEEKNKENEKKDQAHDDDSTNEIQSKTIETADKNSLNNSKLSDSALRLQNTGEDESSSDDEANENDVNKSRKEILRKLNQSDRFNKSVRDLNPDVEASPEVDGLNTQETQDESNQHGDLNEDGDAEPLQVSSSNKNAKENNDSNEDNDDDEGEEEEENEAEDQKGNKAKNESILRQIPVTSDEASEADGENDEHEDQEEEDEEMADVETDSDHDKENESRQQVPKPKHNRALSVSFGNFKSQKRDSLQKRVLQRSFTIGVRISGGEVGTAVIENKPAEESNASTNPSSSSSGNEDTDDAVLSTEDIRYLENIKHMPLGNPLVRTRRQSLALPTNPDMEICTSSPIGSAVPAKKPKRKSLGLLSGNEFNPSQSFVHSLELRKAEFDRQSSSSKRKRLSKSFCGTSEGHDTSIIDLDARHLHKRSKLAIDSSFVDSMENLSASNNKPMCSKVKHSSTPHEKVSKKNDTSIRRILNRCDEILEAANRAKLEAKVNYKKSKVRLPKKNKKKALQRQSLSPESKQNKLFAPLSKEFKRKEKLKRAAAVTRALKASANIIIGKTRKPVSKILQDEEEKEEVSNDSKHLPSNILESIAETERQTARTKKIKKNILGEQSKSRNYATSAGNVVETLRTPEKKKKPKVIQLATGKVCVEPITPTTRSIFTCNGMEFHESPATPYGFSIKFSALDTPQFPHAKDRKRKRNSATEENKKKTFPKPQWTQSGLFVEEEIPSTRPSQLSRILKKHNHQIQQNGSSGNFKQNALFRGDVKRSSARELLQLRERRPLQSNY